MDAQNVVKVHLAGMIESVFGPKALDRLLVRPNHIANDRVPALLAVSAMALPPADFSEARQQRASVLARHERSRARRAPELLDLLFDYFAAVVGSAELRGRICSITGRVVMPSTLDFK